MQQGLYHYAVIQREETDIAVVAVFITDLYQPRLDGIISKSIS